MINRHEAYQQIFSVEMGNFHFFGKLKNHSLSTSRNRQNKQQSDQSLKLDLNMEQREDPREWVWASQFEGRKTRLRRSISSVLRNRTKRGLLELS
uniref:Uncharacterized protein n=1 Tax=Nelumbo nucifera TaxID=4432 RepID=A0A822Y844_NELNU|nr:TPA_asm: hypothetical protein HUJ06_030138 [Nelumbo nucifera]